MDLEPDHPDFRRVDAQQPDKRELRRVDPKLVGRLPTDLTRGDEKEVQNRPDRTRADCLLDPIVAISDIA